MIRTAARVLVAIALAAASAAAHAITCYVVIDRNDNVIYRSTYPPVDMSDHGVAAREAMRRRGDLLMFVEFETCPGLEFVTGSAGTIHVDLAATMAQSALPTGATPNPRPAAKR